MKPSLPWGSGLCVIVLAAIAPAQEPTSGVRPAPLELIAPADVLRGTIQTLELPAEAGEPFSVLLWIDGAPREVTLAPHSVLAADFKLMVSDGAGGYVEHPPVPETTYRGTVAGYPESVVAATLFEGELQGTIALSPEAPLWTVQPVRAFAPGVARGEHLIYSSNDLAPLDVTCGGAIDFVRVGEEGGYVSGADGTDTKICEIALDADVEFYHSNGSSVPATQNDITGVINAVEAIYETAAEIIYDITAIYVETVETDPYSSTNPDTLLNQFKSHWNAQHVADQRDTAHLFTGKNLSGSTIGIAFLNTICNKSQSYGVSQSKFSFSFNYRVGLTAHELGHSWSAQHCDGIPDCKIMCSGIGGCSGSVTAFGVSEANQIKNKKASSGCLTSEPPPAPPVLTSTNPTSADAFGAGPITMNGFFLEDVTQVQVGSVVLVPPFGFTVVSDTQITFNPPTAAALGTVNVVAVNGAGSSNPLPLQIVATDPPALNATGVGLTGLVFNWNFGAQPNDLWYLFVSLNDGSTVPFGGFQILGNGQFVSSGTLNAVGIGGAALVVPPGAAGASVYSQVLLLDGGTFQFQGATNVTTSTILL